MNRLDEIEARANAATKGPWDAPETILGLPATTVFGPKRRHVLYHTGTHIDADFIAHARTDVPALVAALRAVIGLHRIIRVGGAGGATYEVCQNCNQPAPCTYIQTIRQHLGEDA